MRLGDLSIRRYLRLVDRQGVKPTLSDAEAGTAPDDVLECLETVQRRLERHRLQDVEGCLHSFRAPLV